MRLGSLRPFVLAGVALIAALAFAPGASAAVTIGETFTPDPLGCETEGVYMQVDSPGALYAAPTAGVITSWSHLAIGETPKMKLKVGRKQGNAGGYLMVGEGELTTMVANKLNVIPARISVAAGDVLGFYSNTGACAQKTSGYEYAFIFKDQLAGTTPIFTSFDEPADVQLDISAVLEPDADNDGYGDETQDACLGNPRHELPCTDPAPPPGGGVTQPSSEFTVLGIVGKKLNIEVKSAGVVELTELRAKPASASFLKPSPPALLRPSFASGGPGTISIPLRLTKAASQRLAKKGKVTAFVSVTFSLTDRSGTTNQKVSVKIKKPKKKARR